MCGSMADIQSAAAEIRRGKKEEEEERKYNAGGVAKDVILQHKCGTRFDRYRILSSATTYAQCKETYRL